MPAFLLPVLKILGSIWSGLVSFFGDGFRWLGVFLAYRLGMRKERQEQVEQRLEQDNEAADLMRRVDTDSKFRDELRDKFVR